MEPSQEERNRSVLPEDPLEGMGDLSEIDPIDSLAADQPTVDSLPTEARLDTQAISAAESQDFLSVLISEEAENNLSDSADQDAGEPASMLGQLIEAIDDEVEAALEPLRDVAREPVADSMSQEAQFIGFSLAGTDYAVPIENITEIAYIPEVTPLPNVPHWILGVANLRGDLISVVDLRAFFGLEGTTLTGSTRMLVARTTEADLAVGLLVDRAQGLRNLRLSEIEKPTGDIESQIAPYLSGAYDSGDQMLVLLNLDRVLNSPRLRQFEPQVV